MMPTVADLEAYLGAEDALDVQHAEAHLGSVAAMVRAYTRDTGFDGDGQPNEALAAVIVSAAARTLGNPQGLRMEQAGPFMVQHGTFSGWTLPELAVLHRYRVRAL